MRLASRDMYLWAMGNADRREDFVWINGRDPRKDPQSVVVSRKDHIVIITRSPVHRSLYRTELFIRECEHKS